MSRPKSHYDRYYRESKLQERILRRFYIKLIYIPWCVICGASVFSKASECID